MTFIYSKVIDVIRKEAKRLRDVDQLNNEKFMQYIDKKLKEVLERNKQIQEKSKEINVIVAEKRKRVEQIEEGNLTLRKKKDEAQADNTVVEITSHTQ